MATDYTRELRSAEAEIANFGDVLNKISKDYANAISQINKSSAKLPQTWSDVGKRISDTINPLSKLNKAIEFNQKKLEAGKVKENTLANVITDKINRRKQLELQINKIVKESNDIDNAAAAAGGTKSQDEIDRLKTLSSIKTELTNAATILQDEENITNRLLIAESERNKALAAQTELMEKEASMYAIILSTLKTILNLAIAFDKKIGDIAVKSGLTASQFKLQQKSLMTLGTEASKFGASLEDASEAMAAIRESSGLIGAGMLPAINNEVAYMKTNLGIAADEAASFFQTMSEISEKGLNAQQNMAQFAEKVAEANGIPINKLISQVAKSSDEVRTVFRGNTKELIKQAAEVIKIGSSLDSAAKSSKALLNYQESITSELEASALAGQNFNFQAAREAAYRGDFAEQERLITQELEKHGDFNKMDLFTKEAIAKATGKDVSELQKLIVQKKTQRDIEHQFPELANKTKNAQNELAELTRKMNADQNKAQARSEFNQTQINILTKQFEMLLNNIGAAFQPIVEFVSWLLGKLIEVVNIVLDWNNKLSDGWKVVTGITLGIVGIGGAVLSVVGVLKLSEIVLKRIGSKGGGIFTRLAGAIATSVTTISTSISTAIKDTLTAIGSIPWSAIGKGIVILLGIAIGIGALNLAFQGWNPLITGGFLASLGLGLVVFGASLIALGAAVANPLFGPLMALGALAILGFAATLAIAGFGFAIFAKSATPMIPLLESLGKINGSNLINVGLGFASLAFGMTTMIIPLLLFPMSKLERLISISTKMQAAASSFKMLADSITELSNAKFDTIYDGLSKIAEVKLPEKIDISAGSSGFADVKQAIIDSNQKVVDAVNQLNSNIIGGKISVYMDAAKVGEIVGNTATRNNR